MVTLVMISAPIAFLNTFNLVAAQLVVSDVGSFDVFETDQLNAMTLGILNLYEIGLIFVKIFWSLWLLPVGLLILKSKYFQNIIGKLLLTGCFIYSVDSLLGLLFVVYRQIYFYLMLPFAIGEFIIISLFLVNGRKTQFQY